MHYKDTCVCLIRDEADFGPVESLFFFNKEGSQPLPTSRRIHKRSVQFGFPDTTLYLHFIIASCFVFLVNEDHDQMKTLFFSLTMQL